MAVVKYSYFATYLLQSLEALWGLWGILEGELFWETWFRCSKKNLFFFFLLTTEEPKDITIYSSKVLHKKCLSLHITTSDTNYRHVCLFSFMQMEKKKKKRPKKPYNHFFDFMKFLNTCISSLRLKQKNKNSGYSLVFYWTATCLNCNM